MRKVFQQRFPSAWGVIVGRAGLQPFLLGALQGVDRAGPRLCELRRLFGLALEQIRQRKSDVDFFDDAGDSLDRER